MKNREEPPEQQRGHTEIKRQKMTDQSHQHYPRGGNSSIRFTESMEIEVLPPLSPTFRDHERQEQDNELLMEENNGEDNINGEGRLDREIVTVEVGDDCPMAESAFASNSNLSASLHHDELPDAAPITDNDNSKQDDTLAPTPQTNAGLDIERSSSLFLRTVQRSGIEVYAFGCGSEGQLGIEIDSEGKETSTIVEEDSEHLDAEEMQGDLLSKSTLEAVPIPHIVKALVGKDVVGVSAGAFHTLAVTSDGEMYVWGTNDGGQLGMKSSSSQIDTPTRIEALENICIGMAACGFDHTVAISEDGNVYAWGRADAGQLGIGFGPPQQIERPKPVQKLKGQMIARASAGEAHTLFLDADGCVHSTGDGSSGALGLNRNTGQEVPRPILRLWPFSVCQVSAGDGHSAALTIGGVLFTWGRGRSGQLGHGTFENVNVPTAVSALADKYISQVSCGGDFTLAIAEKGTQVWSFGQGRWGATGLMHTDNVCIPQSMKGLENQKMAQISAGGRHALLLTTDNVLYGVGCNESGQCGVGYVGETLKIPTEVTRLPRSRSKVIFIAAGQNHSVVILEPKSGLRNDPFSCETVEEMMKEAKNESMHTSLYDIVSKGEIGARWGLLPFLPSLFELVNFVSSKTSAAEHNDEEIRFLKETLQRTFASPAALLSSFNCLTCIKNSDAFQKEQIATTKREIAAINEIEAKEERSDLPPWQRHDGYEKYYEATLSLQTPLSGTAISPLHLDINKIADVYKCILKVYDTSVMVTLGKAIVKLLDGIEVYLKAFFPNKPSYINSSKEFMNGKESISTGDTATAEGAHQDGTSQLPGSVASLPKFAPNRLHPNLIWIAPTLFILLQNPLSGIKSSLGDQIVFRIGKILSSGIPSSYRVMVRRALQSLLARLPADTLAVRCARPVNNYITSIVESGRLSSARVEVMIAGVLLDVIRQASVDSGDKIPYTEFYNSNLSRAIDLQAEYMNWVSYRDKAPHALVSLCQMPFLLDPEAKSKILHGEAAVQKQHHMSAAAMQAFFQGLNPEEAGFLRLEVRRSNVVEDALNVIGMHLDGDLKKPLKVTFISAGVPEPAQDEGGVRKEFFQLICRDLFRPEFGMFIYDEATRQHWFNISSLETESEFALVGALLGLAIYNNVLLDVHFPMVLYKKLLGGIPTFDDLKLTFPDLGKGLQALLDFEPAEDIESVFCRTFEVEYEFWGEMKRHELIPGGKSIAVTGNNRDQYVKEYTKWILSDSISTQYKAFSRGFLRVCGGPALTMFAPPELELLVCGLPHLDFIALEKHSRYEGGYNESSPVVKWLWQALHAMTLEKKKLFLSFVTGSDRAPVGGLGALKLLIQRAGPDTYRLPTSHTCFNALILPEYSSFEKLSERLTTAISNAQGFGLQ